MPPDALALRVTQVHTCPSFTYDIFYAWDPICWFKVQVMGGTFAAYPVHWLVDWNAWALITSAALQLQMVNHALASNDMTVSVPLYSASCLIFTIVAGALYFGEASQIPNVPMFGLGALVTISGLVVLAREKERASEADKNRGQTERMLPDSGDSPAEAL